MRTEIESNKKITASSVQIEKLKALFPSCFDKDGRFLQHKLEEIIKSEGVDPTREGYSLSWLGKSYSRLLTNLKSETLIEENEEHNKKQENKESKNIMIQGDNLEVLKHLKNAYMNKIKMIYIDPPYNTGDDGFVYKDDRKFTVEQLSQYMDMDEDEAERVLEFTNSKSNNHNAWLTFMYPRLYMARELLREDGFIFTSIDDNELSQLKLLCDEIFGEQNFVGQITVQGNPGGRDYGGIARTHDYILVYSKSDEAEIFSLADREKEFSFNDSTSGFDVRELRNRNTTFHSGNRPNLYYPFYLNPNEMDENGFYKISLDHNEDGWIEVLPQESQGYKTVWRWGKEKSLENLNINIVGKQKKDGGYQIVEKYRKKSQMARSVWNDNEVNTEKGTLLVKSLFGKKVFHFPKPIGAIERIVEMGSAGDDIVLDFFAGSGTTAHAVMALNIKDNGNRAFISVQLDEPTPEESEAHKAGYETVYQICRERILLAADKIKSENPNMDCDLGFKEFKIISANEGEFAHYLDTADTINENYELFEAEKLSDSARKTLLRTWMSYDGLPLTTQSEKIDLDGYQGILAEHILYLMDNDVPTNAIKAIHKKLDDDDSFAPKKLVVLADAQSSKSLRELQESISTTNSKKIDIDLDIRY